MLYEAQTGHKSSVAKPLSGLYGASVIEIFRDHNTDTYRAVYTVRFDDIIYVLHAFQKKSKRGIATAKSDVELIKARLKLAEAQHRLVKAIIGTDEKKEPTGETEKKERRGHHGGSW